ncbi:MAG: hypothetical protein QNK85_07330 [Crocinitomicaceae bacterium]|tara:strand:- start:601 stop:834 length:234 start_codon:yes stop_codon:yes gene_type:complete
MANRKAEYIQKYLPVIEQWREPYFITFTSVGKEKIVTTNFSNVPALYSLFGQQLFWASLAHGAPKPSITYNVEYGLF